MKTIEKLLQEYKIRYKETEEIDDATYPFSPMFKAHHGFKPAIVWEGEWYSMMNINGEVYQNDIWATAKITEKPEKFVIERNTEHKHWGDFHEWWSSQLQLGEKDFDGSSNYFGIDKINKFSGKSLLDFEGFQYLTLDQWAELFLDEPKVGDWVYIEDFDTGNNFVSQFIEPDREGWDVLQKLTPELSAMLTKEINEIKGK